MGNENSVIPTEIGIFPSDWSFSTLGSKCRIYRGGSPRPIQEFLTTAQNGINWIKIGDVEKDVKYINSTQEKIIPEGLSKSRKVKKGDLILSNSMSFGRPYILNIDGCIHDGWLVIQDYRDSFDTSFLYYLLCSEKITHQYIQMAAGSSVKNLNKDKVASLLVTIPPINEQQAIAEALSDIDGLIESLEQLIAKKRQIKQGAMQELLTGTRRLPGFTNPWSHMNLGDLCQIKRGELITHDKAIIGPIPVIAGGKEPAYYHNRANRWGKTITISASGANAGYVELYSTPIFASDCSTIGEATNYSVDFLYYLLLLCQDRLFNIQSGGAQPHVHPNDLYTIDIMVPSLTEQRAIATILESMDKEIETLEEQREKYHFVKLGMMHELLTGKIRLL